jgi:hypothetical protein
MIPLITRLSSTRRAPGWLLGKSGSITAHASSESQNSFAMLILLQFTGMESW